MSKVGELNRTAEALVARVAGALFQAGLIVVLARATPVSEFGAFGLAMALGALALGFFGFGLPTRVLRVQAGDPLGIQRSAILATLVTSTAAGGVAFLLGTLFLDLPWIPVLAGSVAIVGEGFVNVLQNLLFGLERLRRASAVMVVRRLVPVTVVLLTTVLVNDSKSDSTYGALAIGSLASSALCLLLLPRRGRGDAMRVRTLIRESRSYWAAGIWSMGQQLDVVIVGSILGSAPAAAFTAAFRLASPVHIVTSIITSRLIPVVTKLRAENGQLWPTGASLYFKVALGYAGVILLALPGLAFLAIAILGNQFSYAWWVFVILFANSAFSVANQTLAAWIYALDRLSKWVPRMTALSTLLGLAFVAAASFAGSLTLAAMGTLSIQVLLLAMLTFTALAERKYWSAR